MPVWAMVITDIINTGGGDSVLRFDGSPQSQELKGEVIATVDSPEGKPPAKCG